MQLPIPLADALGWLAYQFAELQPYLPTYGHLIVSALFPIYAGAHASLSRPSSAAKRVKKKKKNQKKVDVDEDEDEEDEEEEEKQLEGLSPTDALMFPIMAGCTLAGLYFLIKWLKDLALLNKLLNYYFAIFGVLSVGRMASDGLDVFHSMLFPHQYADRGVIYEVQPKNRQAIPTTSASGAIRASPLPSIFSRVPLPNFLRHFFWMLYILPNQRLTVKSSLRGVYSTKFRLGIHGVEGIALGLATVLYFNFVSKPWWLTNVMGFGFAYGALALMSPTTFWTGTLILSGLFFYDIYFVFYTPMMVTVAKSLEIPVKLLFPRPAPPGADPAIRGLSMLGLGDVVLPGIMIGLALRFDLFLFYLRKQKIVASQESPVESASERTSMISTIGESSGDKDNSTVKDPATVPRKTQSNNKTIKAPYSSVAETLGDRFWTSRILFPNIPKDFVARGTFPKTYFHASLVGYVLGMVTTLVAMQISDHPQPALLYLVPGVLTSLWGTAWVRGEVKQMWEFTEAVEEEEATEKEKAMKKKSGDKSEEELDPSSKGDTDGTIQEKSKALTGGKESKEREKWFTFSVTLPPIIRTRDTLKTDSALEEVQTSGNHSMSLSETSGRPDEHLGKRRRVA